MTETIFERFQRKLTALSNARKAEEKPQVKAKRRTKKNKKQ